MASKYHMINTAYKAEIKGFAENENFWKGFLKTAGNNYKYGFTEQVCIYLQKPEATACAEIGFWNDRIGRWVNKGTKGIALLENDGNKHYLRYVFDVSDTNSRQGYEAPIWKVSKRYYDDITDSLEDSFGELSDKSDFIASVKSAAANLVEDNYIDYLSDLTSYTAGTYFEHIVEAETEKLFKNLLVNSVSYMMLSRCGIEPENHFGAADFKGIYFFNSEKIMTILGSCMSDISEMGLREIESTVKNLRLNEKKKNRTFVKSEQQVYDVAANEKTTKTERNDDYGTDENRVHETGRLFDPELDIAPAGEISPTGQIRNVEENLPERTQESDLRNSSDGQRADEASSRDRQSGERDVGADNVGNGSERRDNRADESGQSDVVGTEYEQHSQSGGGDSPERSHLQLSHHDWNKNTGIDYYHQDDEKNELLRTCEKLNNYRVEIATFFTEHTGRDERGNFIKQFFDNEPVEQILESGQLVGYRAYDDCLHIWRGVFDNREKEVYMKWWSVADHIYGMILLDQWLEPYEPMLLSEEAQISLIDTKQAEKGINLTLPQSAVDYIVSGNGKDFKCSVYELYNKGTSVEDLAKALKNGYGESGHSDAIPGSGLWENHDAKGISITDGIRGEPGYKNVTLSWIKVAKRVTELIEADRYLTLEEKEYYPEYIRKKELREERNVIANEFNSIVRDYNDFQDSFGNKEAMLNAYEYINVSGRFVWGEKKDSVFSTGKDVFVLPKMREAMNKIIAENTHLTERCQKVLEQLNSDIAKPLEPTYDELNPPPESKKEYKISLGDTVHIGVKPYDIVSLGADEVMLFDPDFPIMNTIMSREEFDKKIKENPMNDKYLQVVEGKREESTPEVNATDNTKTRITLDTGDNLVKWIYFNPDSDAGGQYVSGELLFSEFEELVKLYDVEKNPEKADDFRNELEEMSDQLLADVGSIYFSTSENEYEQGCDYVDFTAENILKIHGDILSFETDREHTEVTDIIPEIIKSALEEYYSNNFPEEEHSIIDNDLSNIGLVYSTTENGEHKIEVKLNLNEYKFNFLIDGNPLTTVKCNGIDDVAQHLYTFEFDSLIAFAEAEYHKQNTVIHNNPENPLQKPIGRIDYLSMQGTVQESIEFTDGDRLRKVIEDNNNYGIPMEVVLYADENGNTVPHEYIDKCDPPLQGFTIEPSLEQFVDLTPEIETIADAMEKAEQDNEIVPETTLEAPKITRQRNIPPTVLYPEIKSDYRTNYRIKDDDIGVGFPSERFDNNVMAIKTLKVLEENGQLATPEQQKFLARYVGWGGLSQYFEPTNVNYQELKELLTEDEYASARESTLTAFYTPPVVIRAIYEALGNMNFKEGNILEPSCGIGNFMGMLPESMSGSKFYGIELDSISGRIAQQLYQNSSIAVQGFEKTNLPDSFFDAAVGNVPFGDFKVPDRRYDKNNFLIHDYFFARTIDKVRPGGVIAFVTSKGTLDKENPSVRKYISQRCEFLGAIRLPNDTFKEAAGTEVTSDIIFLQKRDRLLDIDEPWIHLSTDENGIKMNSYFVDNPDMVLGEMKMISGQFGPTAACVPYDKADLGELLNDAIQNIHAEIPELEFEELSEEETDNSIPADPNVRNFSYTVINNKIYYRENSRMNPVDVSATAENRIKGLIEIRDCVRTLIEYQTEDYPDYEIKKQQDKLNELYDKFSKKYGIINSRANNSVFRSDSSYCLLSSLEVIDDDGNFIRKADIFSKRTIKQKVIVNAVDTASEALALSLAEKTCIDMEYMSKLTGKTEEEIFTDLKGVIFLNPMYGYGDSDEEKYLPADEYLSGNVREKLAQARKSAELYPEDYNDNVKALEAVQPKDLSASEISVRLGATWLPPKVVEQFMFELFGTVRYMQYNIKVHFSKYTGEWNVEGKSYDRSNIKATNTYGTTRINGYKIMEETLNLRDVRIFDYVEDESGKRTAVLNKKETTLAQGKQELIKEAFAEWIWSDPERRDKLCKLYNEKFNSNRPREYDGSHLNFVGINPAITLKKHQVDAVAHIIYGGNTLLAHEVGAGKSATRS